MIHERFPSEGKTAWRAPAPYGFVGVGVWADKEPHGAVMLVSNSRILYVLVPTIVLYLFGYPVLILTNGDTPLIPNSWLRNGV